MDRRETQFKSVSRARPCALCEGVDGCSIGNDGLLLCRRRQGQQPGFVCLGQAQGDPQWTLYRCEGDPLLHSDNGLPHSRPRANGQHKPAVDWQCKAEEYARNLTPTRRKELADALGLPEAVLAELPLLGFCPIGPHKDNDGKPLGPCWTFAEADATGRVIGLTCRYGDGQKKAWPGSKRGLTMPTHWRDRTGPTLLPEGPSDVLALTALGLAALGRPSNMGGVDLLAELLRNAPRDRQFVVMGELDANDKGQWPGREGALKTAGELTEKLGRSVQWALPPDGTKDVRQWVLSRRPDPTCADAWHELGEVLLTHLKLLDAKPADCNGEAPRPPLGLALTSLATIRPEPVRWLVPGYLPLGKLVLLAGDGGHGKSALTLGVAACLTRAKPCFGLEYTPLPPADVLLVSCEDDFADTVQPRLLSADADLERIWRVDGVNGKDRPQPFSLAHYEAMECELEARPDVRLVVIDPAGAYIGRAGVDEHKDADLRSLLGPMAELAARRRVTIILVKHLVKGATVKAVHKVGGSAGYVNAVRCAYMVTPDPEDDERKLLLPLKTNLVKKPTGLCFALQSLPEAEQERVVAPYAKDLGPEDVARLKDQLFCVAWQGTVNNTADEVMADFARRDRGPSKVDQAAEWLEQFLATYAYPHAEILEAGRTAGHSKENLFRARRDKLQDKIKASNKVEGRFGGPWYWGPGEPSTWTIRPSGKTATADIADNADNDKNTGESGNLSSIVSSFPPIVSNVQTADNGAGNAKNTNISPIVRIVSNVSNEANATADNEAIRGELFPPAPEDGPYGRGRQHL